MQTILRPSHPKGFTLIELLVAMTISTFILVMVVLGLKTVIQHFELLISEQKNFHQLQYTMIKLNRDIFNLVQIKGDAHSIELVTAQHVVERRAYLLNSDGNLIERTFVALNNTPPVDYHDKILMRHINNFQCRYVTENHALIDSWPRTNSPTPFPKAILITIGAASLGKMTHAFLIQRGY